MKKTLTFIIALGLNGLYAENIKAYKPGFKKVFYSNEDTSESLMYVGGSRNWRNNNWGNLIYGEFAKRHGAIGSDGTFAIFPTAISGRDALVALLRGDSYINKTLKNAMIKYAPYHENDTNKYIKYLESKSGISRSTKLSEVSDDDFNRLATAIPIYEGFETGIIIAKKDFFMYEKAIITKTFD